MTDLCFVSPGVYAYLDPSDSTPRGGSQRQQYLLGTALAARGHTISYLVGDYGQPAEQTLQGMRVVAGSFERLPSLTAAPGLVTRFLRAMRRVDADVYYVRGAPRLAILTAIGCRLLRKPMIFCVANDADLEAAALEDRYGPTVRRAYRWMLRSANAIVAQTPSQQELLRDVYGLESVQIPNGYDLPDGDALLPATEREYVLWVGSSDPEQKQPRKFLEVARSLPSEEFVLVSKPMADESFHSELQREAESLSNVTFIGGVPPDEINEYYRRAKLLVNTSSTEGFPNTFLEAWRFATPVVSLSFDLESVLVGERGGIYAGDVETLIVDVAALAEDTDRREMLGERCRTLVCDQYSLDSVVDQYEHLLEGLME